jgi:hypothetical protein
MKTIAARFEDDLFAALSLVATLEDTTIVAVIREAVEAHIAQKMAEGDLAARAEVVLAEIDREAEEKKAAIGSLFDATPKTTPAAPKGRSRRSQSAEPKAQLTISRPIGYLPALARQEGGHQGAL